MVADRLFHQELCKILMEAYTKELLLPEIPPMYIEFTLTKIKFVYHFYINLFIIYFDFLFVNLLTINLH